MKSEQKPSRGVIPIVLPHLGIALENPNLVLFYLKSGWESNTKMVETYSAFKRLFTCPHPINGLGDMTFG
jgi:hypothetical protein